MLRDLLENGTWVMKKVITPMSGVLIIVIIFRVPYQDILMALLTMVVISINIYHGLFLNYLHGRQEQVLRQFVKERMLLLIQAILHFHLPIKELNSLKRIKHILFF